MLDKVESVQILIASLIIAYLISFENFSSINFLIGLGMALIILIPHILAHKFAAYKLNCEAKFQLPEWRRYWIYKNAEFKRPLPIWLILPILLIFLTKGVVKFFIVESISLTTRVSRVGRLYTELMEGEIGIIALAGPLTNLIIAFIASIAGFKNFGILNLWFAFFTLLPIGSLDGAKVFFGGKIQWLSIFTLTLAMLILFHITNIWISVAVGAILAIIVWLWMLKLELS